MPLVPEASKGGSGVLSQTPATSVLASAMSYPSRNTQVTLPASCLAISWI